MRIKMYEAFLATKDFNYEESVIDPIINIINDNIIDLCHDRKKLSKLFYIYDRLWNAGRICWGDEGILNKDKNFISCEGNPIDKIRELNGQEEDEFSGIIYKSLNMHLTSRTSGEDLDFEKFKNNINNTRDLLPHEKLSQKENKTMDDWVNIMTDENYKYKSLFKDRKSVLEHLLTTIGTGFNLDSNGFISSNNDYSDEDWQNVKLDEPFKKIVDDLLKMPEVKQAIDSSNKFLTDAYKEKNLKDNAIIYKFLKDQDFYDVDVKGILKSDKLSELIKALTLKMTGGEGTKKKKRKMYHPYYQISSHSNIFKISDKESLKKLGIKKAHQSYIDAAIEVCNEIIENKEFESDNDYTGESNYTKAILILANLGVEGYEKENKQDKYEVEEEINLIFADISDTYETKVMLNDSAIASHNNNNYYIRITLDKSYSNKLSYKIDDLKGTKIYELLLSAIDRLNNIDLIKCTGFEYDHTVPQILITAYISKSSETYVKDKEKCDANFEKLGFEVGKNLLRFDSKKLGLIFEFSKPEPLGTNHPSNKNGYEYFSLNKRLYVYEGNNTFDFNIDERIINLLISHTSNDLTNWILEQYDIFKSSDEGYGTYKRNQEGKQEGKQGKKPLYAQDFVVWLDKQKK